jgi:hypothetical protein
MTSCYKAPFIILVHDHLKFNSYLTYRRPTVQVLCHFAHLVNPTDPPCCVFAVHIIHNPFICPKDTRSKTYQLTISATLQ